MICAWKSLLSILPGWMVPEVDKLGREDLQELRLRLGQPPQLILKHNRMELQRKLSADDLNFCVNVASRYSPWAAATAAKGYLTGPGGHRIGLCGEAVLRGGKVEGIKNLTSLNIRVARDFPGISRGIPTQDSLLILGAPGWGKTTLLRDLIRKRAGDNQQVAVVDERGELFPSENFISGSGVDILTGCGKGEGISMLLRTMGPQCIAVDEITEPQDVQSLIQAANCGVRLLATAHAASTHDFRNRTVYRQLMENNIFHTLLVLNRYNTFTVERI